LLVTNKDTFNMFIMIKYSDDLILVHQMTTFISTTTFTNTKM
jgi:hypothetical protein